MDELGPIIVNPDGTTRRISNWDTLTTQEKKSSWRLISKRNKERLAKLKLEQDKGAEVVVVEEKGEGIEGEAAAAEGEKVAVGNVECVEHTFPSRLSIRSRVY